MKRFLLLSVILFTASISAFTQPKAQITKTNNGSVAKSKDFQEIERLDNEFQNIMERSDFAGKQRLLSDDFYRVNTNGVFNNKAQELAATKEKREQLQKSNISVEVVVDDRQIKVYKGAAVITSLITYRELQEGRETFRNNFRRIHIWEKQKLGWRLAFIQLTATQNQTSTP